MGNGEEGTVQKLIFKELLPLPQLIGVSEQLCGRQKLGPTTLLAVEAKSR